MRDDPWSLEVFFIVGWVVIIYHPMAESHDEDNTHSEEPHTEDHHSQGHNSPHSTSITLSTPEQTLEFLSRM